MRAFIQREINALLAILEQTLTNEALLTTVEKIAEASIHALRAGHKLLLAGNGGSAADAQHLAAEFVVRLCDDRPGIPAIALTTDSSALTAISNDYGFQYLFSRQIETLGQKGDVFFGISTSGKSPNIITALKAARGRGLITVGFTGKDGGMMPELCDYTLIIPASDTQKIQECHITLGHILCGLIEKNLFK